MLVSGRVQGVFYRARCAERARELGLGGHVRNLPDGRVEAVFEGEEDAVEAAVQWCREGTEWSSVQSVEVEPEPPQGATEFSIRH